MDFQALLPAGLHTKTMREIQTLCIESFAKISPKRELLFNSLITNLLQPLEQTGLKCNVWIDGSFVTEKTEPNDIDLVIEANDTINQNQNAINLLSPILMNNAVFKSICKCDVYFFYKNNSRDRAYWKGQFCFDRSDSSKGIII
ncbi:MAG: hypothetical protein LBU09_00580 [Endomicrobium sp.]|jgi:hypothetical protein|nr:hypothetical protein [Endomicrobium sp.]